MVGRREHLAPCEGDYLTDGKRLVVVLGIDRKGRYECEDCKDAGLVHIPVEQMSKWRLVEAEAA